MAYDEDLVERVRLCLEGEPGVREKRMFGGLAFLLDGHMAMAANSHGTLMVRVDPAQTDDLVAGPGVNRVEMQGRSMKGWLDVESAAIASVDALERWVDIGVEYVRLLPPKG